MRQNLTNVKEIDIKDVEHFYVVGSTTKEGLLEGKSNVKLDLKKAASGGGTSNEDAERMYEALFGQVPYVPTGSDEEVVMTPLYEVFPINPGIEILSREFYYKSSAPVPKAYSIGLHLPEDTDTTLVFSLDTNVALAEIPPEMSGLPDTWYAPVGYDINLVGYTIPTEGNPTIVSGTLPDKSEIRALTSDHPVYGEDATEIYLWVSDSNAFERGIDDSTYYYALRQSDNNVIEWSLNHRTTPPA